VNSAPFKMQLASNVIEDGLGLELLSPAGDVVADVFRSDRDRSVDLKIWDSSVPSESICALASEALRRLDPFEDGTPLAQAKNYDLLRDAAVPRPNTSLERTRDR
jgi:hypothetical protein